MRKRAGGFSSIYNVALSFTFFYFFSECSSARDDFFPSITHISQLGELQGTIPAVKRSAISSFSRILTCSSRITSMGSSVGFSRSISFATADTAFLGNAWPLVTVVYSLLFNLGPQVKPLSPHHEQSSSGFLYPHYHPNVSALRGGPRWLVGQ